MKKIKMISLKNQTYFSDKNKLTPKTHPVNLSLFNMMIQKKQEKKLKLFQTHSLPKNQHLLQKLSFNSNLKKTVEYKSPKVITQEQQNILCYLKTTEKQNFKKITSMKNIRKNQKSRTVQPFRIIRNQSKKLTLHPKSSCEKNQRKIIELLNICKNNSIVHKGSQFLNKAITENQKILEIAQKVNHQSSQNILWKKTNNTLESQITQKGQSHRRQTRQKSINISLIKNMTLNSKVTSMQIQPQQKSGQKVNVEIQTVQNEEQYFDYLLYKRKKQQYEQKLSDFFDYIQIIEQDRMNVQNRNDQMLEIYSEQPHDDRERRIFELKKDMQKQQQKTQMIINEKYQKDEIIQDRFNKFKFLNKLDEMLKNHFVVLKQVFENLSNEKYLRIIERIRNLISHVLSEVIRQINYQINKSRACKKQSASLRNAFNQYINFNYECKQLLKNCFEHLKKTPELCYELLGENSQQTGKNLYLKNQNNDFQKPKCVSCFNTQWKLNTIAEQNIHMKSVLKVTEQLLK